MAESSSGGDGGAAAASGCGGTSSSSSSSSSNNWWGFDGWIQAAKEKSAQTYELIKHDLQEFSQVCSQDASAIMTNTSEAIQSSIQTSNTDGGESSNRVKESLTSLLGGISKVLTIPPDDESDDDVLRVTPGGNLEVFDKAKARLYEIQTSITTYCNEPEGTDAEFEVWRQTFNIENRKGEISELLVSEDNMRSVYTKLVPSAVSHADFWERYFYKVYQLEKDEQRKADLKNRADKLKNEQEETAWGDDDWGESSPAELPELSKERSTNVAESLNQSDDMSTNNVSQPSDVASDIIQPLAHSNLSPPADKQADRNSEMDSITITTSSAELEPLPASTLTDDEVARSTDVKVQDKGSYVMIGSDRETPVSSISSSNKESSSLDDEWEKEFDAAGLDMDAVHELAEKLKTSDQDDVNNWDSWE